LAIHQYRARSAKPLSATVLGPGQSQVIAKNPQKSAAGINLQTHSLPIEVKSDGLFHADTSDVLDVDGEGLSGGRLLLLPAIIALRAGIAT
jgi:hypothetical protein